MHRLTVSLLTDSKEQAEELVESIEEILRVAMFDGGQRVSEVIRDKQVFIVPHVPGGASDPGESFDRQAARTSGVTVDVTQPGGVN